MKLKNKRILMSMLVVGLILTMTTPNIINANELEETKEEDVIVVDNTTEQEEPITQEEAVIEPKSERSIVTLAATDAAFPATSQPLHDAILAKYAAIDGADGSVKDGVISKGEAAAWAGAKIDVKAQDLDGTITGIEYFTNPALKSLLLQNNNFTGTIPTELGNLSSLTTLYLNNNKLTGSIPTTLGNMSSLEYLSLAINELTGTIPTELANLGSLKQLYLYTNELTGTIPKELGNLSNLQQLRIYRNNLTGAIPTELGNLSQLTQLHLQGNQLTGTIPVELTNLPLLSVVYLNDNNLSGEIPAGFANLANLKEFVISNNSQLTGDVTTLFDSHPSLEILVVINSNTTQARPQSSVLKVFIYNILNSTKNDVNNNDEIEELKQELEKLMELKNVVPGSDTMYDNLINEIQTEEIAVAENIENAKEIADDLLTPDKTDLNSGVGQTEVTNAKNAVVLLPDGDVKINLQADVNLAQAMLDAKEAVENLFDTDGTLFDQITDNDIENAMNLVSVLPAGSLKTELESKVKEAQQQFDSKSYTFVEGFATFTGTGSVSAKVNAPVEKFNAVYVNGTLLSSSSYTVTSGSTVITLNEIYLKTFTDGTYNVEVEFKSGVKVSTTLTVTLPQILQPPVEPTDPLDPSKPILPEVPEEKPSIKPTISGGATASGNTVNTGDTSNLPSLYVLLGSSLLAFVVIMKKRKEAK